MDLHCHVMKYNTASPAAYTINSSAAGVSFSPGMINRNQFFKPIVWNHRAHLPPGADGLGPESCPMC